MQAGSCAGATLCVAGDEAATNAAGTGKSGKQLHAQLCPWHN